MRPYGTRVAILVLMTLLSTAMPLSSQSVDEWRQDVDTLAALIGRYHPKPWEKISREDFMLRKAQLKGNLGDWTREKTIVEMMKLVASLKDGHTGIVLNNKAGFNLWFPVRMERFPDGIFVIATDELHQGLLGTRILKIGNLQAEEAYRQVAQIVPMDSGTEVCWRTSNYIANAVALKALGIIQDDKRLDLEVANAQGVTESVELTSAPWRMRGNWMWNKAADPTTNTVKTIYDDHMSELPPYLARMIPNRIPYWFEFYPDRKLLFLQWNAVTDWNQDPFAEFTKKLFKTLDENKKDIDKFVIDMRFNEGGNGYLLPPFVQEFILRRDLLPRGKLFIITGSATFSAAPNFIGQMLKQTSAITVGDVAPGPLNWCSDVLDFELPNSNLILNVSSMFWMTGHAMDKRGCYPPHVYLSQTYKDYVSWKDGPLEAILANQVVPLKDILVEDGWVAFKAEFDRRKSVHPDVRSWFPYTHFDLVLTTYVDLLQAKKSNDALELARFTAELYPGDLRSWYGLAEVAKELDDIDLALGACERLLAMEPNMAEIRSTRLDLVLRRSYRDRGITGLAATFAELKASNPKDMNEGTLNAMGYGYLQSGKSGTDPLELVQI
jgi:tetratricopeptide (TPR) repeat protein